MVKVNDLKYDKDNLRVSFGINDGCRLFQLEADKILEIHRSIGESVLHLSYLSENRIAIVTHNDPNVLKKLIVGLFSHIISTSLTNSSIEGVITDVAPGYKGLIAMSSNPVKYMAFPSSMDGHVKVVNFQTNTIVTTINAHYRKISALSMNDSETLLATASEVGTVIRVFDLPTGVKLKELRRGHSSFSQETPAQQPITGLSAMIPTASTSWSLGLISGMCESIYNNATYIPSVIGSAFISERDFAVAKVPSIKKCLHPKKFAFDKMWLLIAADFQGHIHYFKFDTINGGECPLIKSFRFHEIPQQADLEVTNLSRFGNLVKIIVFVHINEEQFRFRVTELSARDYSKSGSAVRMQVKSLPAKDSKMSNNSGEVSGSNLNHPYKGRRLKDS
ncbi:hypothetical protein ACTXT7_003794 [Hymenolepis weldensis]